MRNEYDGADAPALAKGKKRRGERRDRGVKIGIEQGE